MWRKMLLVWTQLPKWKVINYTVISQFQRVFRMNSHQNNFAVSIITSFVFDTIPNMSWPSPGSVSCCSNIHKGKASWKVLYSFIWTDQKAVSWKSFSKRDILEACIYIHSNIKKISFWPASFWRLSPYAVHIHTDLLS